MNYITLFFNYCQCFFLTYWIKPSLSKSHVVGGGIQLPSHVRHFVIPWTAAHQAFLSFTTSRSLPKFMSIASVMPSSHLILWRPFLLPSILPSIRNFSNESAVCIRWPKYWSFSFRISPFNEYSGLISLKIGMISLLSKRLSGVCSSTIIWRYHFFNIKAYPKWVWYSLRLPFIHLFIHLTNVYWAPLFFPDNILDRVDMVMIKQLTSWWEDYDS